MDNLLQDRLSTITTRFAPNFVIQDISSQSIVVVQGVERECKFIFALFGLIVNETWAKAIHDDGAFNSYLAANNLAWYFSVDTEAHVTFIYIVEKGDEIL